MSTILVAVVFAPWERTECRRRAQEMATKRPSRRAAVAALLREGLEDCLAVLSFPEHQRRKLARSNLLESLMTRLKKRTRVVGIFPNRAACDRLSGAQLREVQETWQLDERAYFNLDGDGA